MRVSCGACNGTGFAAVEKRFTRPLLRLTDDLAHLAPAESGNPRGHDLAIETTGRTTLRAAAHADQLEPMLNPWAERLLAGGATSIGEPVAFTGVVVDRHLDGPPVERRWLVAVDGADGRRVLVTEAQVMWKSEAGAVLVGGVIAGQVETPKGDTITIVQGGFIVSPK